MGGHAYWYVVPHEDVKAALDKLRVREFKAGRYNPAMPFLNFPVTAQSGAPGAKHGTIEEALEASGADGTRSILDISQITEEPEYFSACPLEDVVILNLYGTMKPTRAAVEEKMDFLEDVERGQAVYLELYENGVPTEILFAGYSFD